MIFAAVRALATLAAQCRDAVTFCRTPHAGSDRLWAETSRRDGADRLAEQEAEEEVSEPCAEQQIADEISEIAAEFGDTFRSGLLRPIVGSSARLDAFEARLFALEKLAGQTPTRIHGYPPFNPSNPQSSSADSRVLHGGLSSEESPASSFHSLSGDAGLETSSVDGEAATVAGPPTEDRPVASVSADPDATGPPTSLSSGDLRCAAVAAANMRGSIGDGYPVIQQDWADLVTRLKAAAELIDPEK